MKNFIAVFVVSIVLSQNILQAYDNDLQKRKANFVAEYRGIISKEQSFKYIEGYIVQTSSEIAKDNVGHGITISEEIVRRVRRDKQLYGPAIGSLKQQAAAYEASKDYLRAYSSYMELYNQLRWSFIGAEDLEGPRLEYICDKICNLYYVVSKIDPKITPPPFFIQLSENAPEYNEDYRNTKALEDSAAIPSYIIGGRLYYFEAPDGYCIEKLDCQFNFNPILEGFGPMYLRLLDPFNSEITYGPNPRSLHINTNLKGESFVKYELNLPRNTDIIRVVPATTLVIVPFSWSIKAKLAKVIMDKNKGKLLIIVNENGASISIDGKIVSTNPRYFTDDISIGSHTIKVSKDKCKTYSKKINIIPDETTIEKLSMSSEVPRGWKAAVVTDMEAKELSFIQSQDGKYVCVFSNEDDDIYLTKSKNLTDWDHPKRLAFSSEYKETCPKLLQNEKGVYLLAFISDKPVLNKLTGRMESFSKTYIAFSSDLEKWSDPILAIDRGRSPYDLSKDADRSYKLISAGFEGDQKGEIEAYFYKSDDGIIWEEEAKKYKRPEDEGKLFDCLSIFRDGSNKFYTLGHVSWNEKNDFVQHERIQLNSYPTYNTLNDPIILLQKSENICFPAIVQEGTGDYILFTVYRNYISFSESKDGKTWSEPINRIRCWLPNDALLMKDIEGRYIVAWANNQGIFLNYTKFTSAILKEMDLKDYVIESIKEFFKMLFSKLLKFFSNIYHKLG